MSHDNLQKHPLVSVVIPTYNNAVFIRQTMGSILNQSYDNLQIVVSDHGSDDGTWMALQPFAVDPRVTLLQMSRSNRVADNWANATNRATGKYIKLVCGDDLLRQDCIERQVAALEASPAAVMAAARRDIVSACGDPLLKSWGLPGMIGEVPGRVAVRDAVRSGTNPFGEPACVLLVRAVLTHVGGWDDRFPYVIDQMTYSKVLMHGSLVGIGDPLAYFRMSRSQWSIALADSQYRQVVGFHSALAREHGGLLTARDRTQGRARARALSFARRFAYQALSRKLRAPELLSTPDMATATVTLPGS